MDDSIKLAKELVDYTKLVGVHNEHIQQVAQKLLISISGNVNKRTVNIKNNNNPTHWSQIMTDHHPAFAVGKYYRVCGTTKLTYEVTPNDVTEKQETKFYVDHEDRFVKMNLHKEAIERDTPATAEQIATFKRAAHFASKGRKLDEFRVGDEAEDERHKGIVTAVTNDNYLYIKRSFAGGSISSMESVNSCTLIQTAEELQGGS